jgi:hypothetical protein
MLTDGGASELNRSGGPSLGGEPEAGGSAAGGPAVHPDHMDTHSGGGGGTDGAGMPDAGSSDGGSSDLGGSAGSSFGGASGSGGLLTSAGGSNGGSSSGGADTAGGSSILPQPTCDDGVAKGDPCAPSSTQVCYKGCGPDNVGYKPLACQGGVYQETQSGCTFPTGRDYSCYSVPPSLPAECPNGVPRGGRACSIAACKVCFGGSVFAPQYQDSTGVQKEGYCVCSAAGVWTCGTRPDAWPCSNNQACH